MLQIAGIGIHYGLKGERIPLATQGSHSVPFYSSYAFTAEMPAVRKNDRSEKRHATLHRDNLYLPIIQVEVQPAVQEIRNKRNCIDQPLTGIIDDEEIIDISPVMVEAEVSLDVLVQFVEIHVAEKLRREITDGETAAGC